MKFVDPIAKLRLPVKNWEAFVKFNGRKELPIQIPQKVHLNQKHCQRELGNDRFHQV